MLTASAWEIWRASTRISADKAALVTLGVVLYDDVSNMSHETDVCLLSDKSLTTLQHCLKYNSMR